MVQENIDIQITTSDIQGVMQEDPNVALRIQNKALNRVSLALKEEIATLKAKIAELEEGDNKKAKEK
tara:strand:- start:26 stop:226 length:201 start_codon:yes stop_codon:yes gene_type:complete